MGCAKTIKFMFTKDDILKWVGGSSTTAPPGPLIAKAQRHMLYKTTIAAAPSCDRLYYKFLWLMTCSTSSFKKFKTLISKTGSTPRIMPYEGGYSAGRLGESAFCSASASRSSTRMWSVGKPFTKSEVGHK